MPRSTVTIERKGRDARQAARVLARAMREAQVLELNAPEASSLTGLPIDRCEEALFHLARAYPARLKVTEAGTLYFAFARLNKPAPLRGWRALLATIERNHSRVARYGTFTLAPVFLFSIAYNAFILPSAPFFELTEWTWVATVSATIAIMAALFALALLMYNPLIGLPILAGYSWLFGSSPLHETTILVFLGWSYSLVLKRMVKLQFAGEVDSWLQLAERWARGYIYGPEKVDPLEDERRLTAAILAHDRVLTLRDLMLLFDWDKEEAESQLPRLLVDYGGELVVTEEGALVLRFDAQPVDAGRFGRRLDTRPAHARNGWPGLWACPPGLGVTLTLVIAFLLWGMWVHPWFSLFPVPPTWAWLYERAPILPVLQGLGAWPYLLVLLPSLLRLPAWLAQLVGHAGAHGRRRLLALLEDGAEGGPMRRLDTAALARLGGEIDLARQGEGAPWVCFPLLAAGEREAEILRREARKAVPAGPVVYDTGPETSPR